MTTAAKPFATFDNADVDLLAEYPTMQVPARSLRDGMLILDDLATPVAWVDHKMPTPRDRSGAVEVFVEDLENGGWIVARFHANRLVTVAAAAAR